MQCYFISYSQLWNSAEAMRYETRNVRLYHIHRNGARTKQRPVQGYFRLQLRRHVHGPSLILGTSRKTIKFRAVDSMLCRNSTRVHMYKYRFGALRLHLAVEFPSSDEASIFWTAFRELFGTKRTPLISVLSGISQKRGMNFAYAEERRRKRRKIKHCVLRPCHEYIRRFRFHNPSLILYDSCKATPQSVSFKRWDDE